MKAFLTLLTIAGLWFGWNRYHRSPSPLQAAPQQARSAPVEQQVQGVIEAVLTEGVVLTARPPRAAVYSKPMDFSWAVDMRTSDAEQRRLAELAVPKLLTPAEDFGTLQKKEGGRLVNSDKAQLSAVKGRVLLCGLPVADWKVGGTVKVAALPLIGTWQVGGEGLRAYTMDKSVAEAPQADQRRLQEEARASERLVKVIDEESERAVLMERGRARAKQAAALGAQRAEQERQQIMQKYGTR